MVTVVSTQPHRSVVREAICKDCGSTLEYVPKDVKNRTVRDYTGERELIHYIDCPNCNHQVAVKGY